VTTAPAGAAHDVQQAIEQPCSRSVQTRRQIMADEGSGGSSVNIVAIIAILVLVGVGAWFFLGRSRPVAPAGTTTTQSSTTPPATDKKPDVTVKVDLPDSVTIK
jgi:hypothetical protein